MWDDSPGAWEAPASVYSTDGAGRAGARDRAPRASSSAETLLRHALVSAIDAGPSQFEHAIRAGLRDPRRALGFLELGAKLNGEIGRGAANRQDRTPVIVAGETAKTIAAFRAAAAKITQQGPKIQ